MSPGTTAPAPPRGPPPASAVAPIRTRLLSSVAKVALTAALVCGAGGPAAVVAAAQAVPFVRPPPLQGKPFASSTPYAQSQKLQLGLDKLGKIRACPSTNPGCVSTNPLGSSGSFASPLLIPESSAGEKAVVSLRQAIEKTQSNVDFKVDEDTQYGHYIEAEMDGGVGRDVMEFLVKKDAGVVAYRCMATKVTFVYPFTTAVGDSKGQKQRIAAISQELGWYAPDIQSSMDSADDVNYVP
ncbi:thylakoid lumenal 17.9 kDa protein, chloroplastic-like [Miscanthus floridulus]|uniref:thylakoid lumenal 17.9 kDa protein, chloroplastic-like n=1 Tax=Miscanthus floridulus TaxID=154761 RepID=UPI0034581964